MAHLILYTLIFTIFFTGSFLIIVYFVRKSRGLNGFDLRFRFKSPHFYNDDGSWKQKEKEQFKNDYPKKWPSVWFTLASTWLISFVYLIFSFKSGIKPFLLPILAGLLGLIFGIIFDFTFYTFNKWVNKYNSLFSYEIVYVLIVTLLVLVISLPSIILIPEIHFLPVDSKDYNPLSQWIFLTFFLLTFLFIRFLFLLNFIRGNLLNDFNRLRISDLVFSFESIDANVREKIVYLESNKIEKESLYLFINYPTEWFIKGIDNVFERSKNYLRLRPSAKDFTLQEILSANFHYGYHSKKSCDTNNICKFPYRKDHKQLNLHLSATILVGWKQFLIPVDPNQKYKDLFINKGGFVPFLMLSYENNN